MRRSRSYGALIFLTISVLWILYRLGQSFFGDEGKQLTDLFNIQPVEKIEAAQEDQSTAPPDDQPPLSPIPTQERPESNELEPPEPTYESSIDSQESAHEGDNANPQEEDEDSEAAAPQPVDPYATEFDETIRNLKENLAGEAVRFPAQAGDLLLTISIDKPGRCFGGDFTAIRGDLKSNPNLRLIASIDNGFGNGRKKNQLSYIELSENDDSPRTLVVPKSNELRLIGIYICSVGKNATRCNPKVTSISKILEEQKIRRMNIEAGRKPPRPPKRRTYFYAPMLIKDSDAILLHPDDLNNNFVNTLANAWPSLGKKQISVLKKTLKEIKQTASTLNSEALQYDRGSQRLVLTLPDYDLKSCQK